MNSFFQDIIHNLIAFQQDKPLLFTHLFFWIFFSFVLFGYSFLYKFNKARTIYLLLVSFFFYYKTSGVFLLLLLFTICSDYIWGKCISSSKKIWKKKLFVAISVCLNLFLLGYFKYAYFFTESANQIFGTHIKFFNHFSHFSNSFFSTSFSVDKLILPVGISFFTFQSLSYIIDLYREKIKPVNNIFEYGFFVCFFPHLVAGPIVKAHEFLYQINLPYKLYRSEFGMAIFWVLNGLAKKVLADYIGVNFVDRIFENPNYYSGIEVVLGTLGYSLQIYADFSGYTDIAIGVALLLGFRLKTNFNSPYKAQSTSEFWQRWHISLSSWLKEYLYIPLGGNRQGSLASYLCITLIGSVFILLSGALWLFWLIPAVGFVFGVLMYFFASFKKTIHTNINIMITMLLGGLWHGSSWLFMIWGGLNGLGLVIHKLWQKIVPNNRSENPAVKFFWMLLTLLFISFTRIWFRSDDLETVANLFDRIQNHLGLYLTLKIMASYQKVLWVIAGGYFIHWLPERFKNMYRTWFSKSPIPVLSMAVVLLVFLLYQAMSADMQPFIYFQF
ncbi:MAG: MBOAT family protein [Bacteroidetes bacterium]|nr:MBOAT family protein [Bacteroidota bacterium]